MELSIVVNAMGLRGALSHRTYESMVATWIDSNEPIPTLDECRIKWAELVASGMFEPPYYVKRAEAYAQAGLYLQDIAELTAELNMAQAANNADDVAKYSKRLADIHAQRAAIKAQHPKA
jgi:hypothetical protein